jgi:hypothetical protein
MRKILSALLFGLALLSWNMAAASTPMKTWTFLIYLNGNNNLDSFGKQNIKDMEKVGSNDQVNIVVQWASRSAKKTVRMLIKKNPNGKIIASPIIQNLGNVDMGSSHSLEEFIQWGVENYPAEHYFVNVWNHGSGWHALRSTTRAPATAFDISWDDFSGHSISTEDLGLVMAKAAKIMGHKVDIYGSDACLMAMGEVAAEMNDDVSYFAGSEETEPGAGWPYADLLLQWEATEHATPEQVVKILTDVYVKSYQKGGDGEQVTFSAYDLSKLTALNQAIATLSTSLQQLGPKERASVIRASNDTQRFTFADYADLLDFIKHLSAENIKGLDKSVLESVQTAASDLIIANADTDSFANATGLSIWIPQYRQAYNQHSERYKGMKFNIATHWGDALSALLPNSEEENNKR